MMPLNTLAPDFVLPDTISGKSLGLQQIKGEKGTLIMFICNHCPFVIHLQQALGQLGRDYIAQGIGIAAINSNDIDKYPQDSPENMRPFAKANDFTFPYLFDQSQAVARAYDAACTPDFFLFDAELKCVYRGQFDDSRPGNDIAVSGSDLRAAIEALLNGTAVSPDQKPSLGCNIKWKN
jgi:peroxiredoxin